MTIETLEKRIAGKEKAIAALEKKIQRIEAAKATNWEKNPYWYNERDLECAQRDLESERRALKGYKDQLTAETEKANSRNIKVLVDFLEAWKARAIEFFKEQQAEYKVAFEGYREKDRDFCNRYNNRWALGLTGEQIKELREEHRKYRKDFEETWAHVLQFYHGDRTWEENLKRDLEIEKNRKYDDIIERTNKIVGQITDASGLCIGDSGDLNGVIIGTKGVAKVTTIGAGGWNIQCWHYRTLIKKIS